MIKHDRKEPEPARIRAWSIKKMNLERNAIEILHLLCQNSGCVISDSGGKDSSVLKHIAMKAKEKYRLTFSIQHNHTTADAPETVYYVREEQQRYKAMGIEYNILYPKKNMWQLIIDHCTPPTRLMRYCCSELKEYNGYGEKLITGVRKAESKNRRDNQGIVTFPKPKKELRIKTHDNEVLKENKKGGIIVLNLDNAETRELVETCYRTSKTLINPLIDWEDDYLWWYIRSEGINLNPLYSCGQNRIGCIGCPMAGKKRWKEFERYPKYKNLYMMAFEKMLQERERRGLIIMPAWKNAQCVFDWWMEDENIDGQYSMDFDGADLVGFKEKGI